MNECTQAFVLDYSFDSSDPADKSGSYADNAAVFKQVVCACVCVCVCLGVYAWHCVCCVYAYVCV